MNFVYRNFRDLFLLWDLGLLNCPPLSAPVLGYFLSGEVEGSTGCRAGWEEAMSSPRGLQASVFPPVSWG